MTDRDLITSISDYSINQGLLSRTQSTWSIRTDGKYSTSPSMVELNEFTKKYTNVTVWKSAQLYKINW